MIDDFQLHDGLPCFLAVVLLICHMIDEINEDLNCLLVFILNYEYRIKD